MNENPFTTGLETLIPRRRDKLINQPFNFLFLFAALVFVFPLLFWGQGISMRVSRVMVFFTDRQYCWILTVLLVCNWFLYLISWRILWKRYLMHVHIAVTLFLITLLVGTGKWIVPTGVNSPQAFLLRTLLKGITRELQLVSWQGIAFTAAQLCFLVNITVGIMLGRRKSVQDTRLQKA